MATMISEVYDAFRAAEGVGEDKARKAAEAIAAYGNRFNGLELKIEALNGAMRLLHWMIGALLAVNITMLIRSYFL